jgi:acyl carrier protein|tara:strand:- start:1206 stop:1442 length:237 start_codon:yes stop_codon:yes gene_type:complete
MSSIDKYRKVFKECFQYDGDVDDLEYQSIEEWDSVAHMQLMAELEDEFKVEMDIDDIIDFSSFKEGIKILSKYDVEIA